MATAAFAERGVFATSLDDLAGQMGVTKQTILYHFKSKDGLIEAVLLAGADELARELSLAVAIAEPGFDQVESAVRGAFALAVRRPELLGLLGEVHRLSPAHIDQVISVFQPQIDVAIASLESAMHDGTFRSSDPRLLLVAAYGVVTAAVSDAAVLQAVGLRLDLRVAAQLRRTVIDFMRAALAP